MRQELLNSADDTLKTWLNKNLPENLSINDEDDFIIEEGYELLINSMNNDNEEYKLIPVGNGLFTKVSNEDYETLKNKKWYIRSNDGYVCRNETLKGQIVKAENYRKTKQRSILLHRFIMGMDGGNVRYVVDHINGDKLDNRRENLRIVTVAQNLWNVHSNKSNKTGSRGVSKTKGGKFKAVITANNKRVYLGTFETVQEADLAYKKAKETYHRI